MLSVKLPKKPRKAKKKDSLTQEDIDKLFDRVKNDIDIVVFIFALSTGLRQGEIFALDHTDLSINKATVNVDKTLSKTRVIDSEGKRAYKTLITSPKSASSIRIAPIPDRIIPYLKRHVTNEKKKHLAKGVKFLSNSPLFTSAACGRLDASNLRKRWNKLQDELGIERIRFHDLRHTFCSLLAENGVELKTASELMGHGNIQTTARIYTHIKEEKKKEAVNQLNDVFKG